MSSDPTAGAPDTVGKLEGVVDKSGDSVNYLTEGVSDIQSRINLIKQVYKDKKAIDDLAEKLITALAELAQAESHLSGLMLEVHNQTMKAQALAARASSAQRDYKPGF